VGPGHRDSLGEKPRKVGTVKVVGGGPSIPERKKRENPVVLVWVDRGGRRTTIPGKALEKRRRRRIRWRDAQKILGPTEGAFTR